MTSARSGWVTIRCRSEFRQLNRKCGLICARSDLELRVARDDRQLELQRIALPPRVHGEVDREPAGERHCEAGGDAERARRGHDGWPARTSPSTTARGQTDRKPDDDARRAAEAGAGSGSSCQPCTYIQRRSPCVTAGQTTPLKKTMLTMSATR